MTEIPVAPDPRAGLRRLLNEWDFIGVADEVSDEYDCMIDPLLTKLSNGADRTDISEYLFHELSDHFGLQPTDHDEADQVADKLVSWWATDQPTAEP